jgi:prepilin-type N-terminal cleavage/methylation domain-containing protein
MRSVLFRSASVKQAGFTIVEIIVVVSLISLLILAFLNLYDRHGRLFSFENGVVRTTSGTRAAMSELQQYVLQAQTVVASRTIGGINYSSGAGTLILELPAIDSSNNPISNTWDYVVFYITGSSLYRTIEVAGSSVRLGGTKLLSDTAISLAFTYNNADFSQVSQINVDLTSQIQVNGQAISSREQQQIYLRNF